MNYKYETDSQMLNKCSIIHQKHVKKILRSKRNDHHNTTAM